MDAHWKLTIGLVLLVALAGCLGGIAGDDADGIEYVPDDAEMVVSVDMAGVDDPALEPLFDQVAATEFRTADTDALFDEFHEETGLDLRDVASFTAYTVPVDREDSYQQESLGFVIDSDWSEDELVETIEAEERYSFTETDRGDDVTVYEPDVDSDYRGSPLYIAALGNGQFIIGEDNAANGAIDIATGDADAISGDMRDVYSALDDGAVTVVYNVADEDIPRSPPDLDADVDAFTQVSVVGSSVSGDGDDTVTADVHLQTSDSGTAEEVADVSDAVLAYLAGTAESDGEDVIAEEFRAIDVEQDGSTVVVTYENDIDSVMELLVSLGIVR